MRETLERATHVGEMLKSEFSGRDVKIRSTPLKVL